VITVNMKAGISAAVFVGLAALSQSVLAQTVDATYQGSANFGSGGVGYGSGSISPNPNGSDWAAVGVGGDSFTTAPNTYSFTSASGSFNAWCVDISTWLSGGTTTYALGGTTELTSVFGATRVSDLTMLANERYSLVDTRDESAAFQLATWAIMYGTADASGNYSLNSATFNTSSGITGGATAQSWLDSLGTIQDTGQFGVTYLYQGLPSDVAKNSQDLVVFTPTTPVPEPGTPAMLLVGLGLMAFVARRRNKSLDPAA